MKKSVIISIFCVLIAMVAAGCTITISPKTEATSAADDDSESSSKKSSASKSSTDKSSADSDDSDDSSEESSSSPDDREEESVSEESSGSEERYDMGVDSVETVPTVLGARKRLLSTTGTNTFNGEIHEYWEYTYASSTVSDDLNLYLTWLSDHYDYVNTTDFNLYQDTGTVQFAVESKEPGKLIILDCDWDEESFHLKFTRAEGNLNRYG